MDARLGVGSLLAAVCLLSACGGGGGSEAATTPVGNPGVFVPGVAYVADAEVDERFELYTAALDGTEWRKVSGPLADGLDVGEIQWAPDRSLLLYVAVDVLLVRRSVHVADPAGGGSVEVDAVDGTAWIGDVRWSPDSESIAYAVRDVDVDTGDVHGEIRVATPFGGPPIVLSAGLETSEVVLELAWAPDSSRVAFRAQASPLDRAELHVATRDDADVRVVSGPMTAGGGVEPIFLGSPVLFGSGGVLPAAWSPDSLRLAYVADQEAQGVTELFLSMRDGTGNVKANEPLDGAEVWAAEWAPDGSRLAYLVSDDILTDSWISTVLPNATGRVRISDPPEMAARPAGLLWSPDSSSVAFPALFEPVASVLDAGAFLAPADEPSQAGLLAGFPNTELEPFVSLAWSPGGDRLAYLVGPSSPELRSIDAVAGGDVVVSGPMSAPDAVVDRFAWAPDGSRLAYLANATGAHEVFTSYPDGSWGNERISPALPDGYGTPSQRIQWTPDGSGVVYRTDLEAYLVYELFLSTPDGSETTRLSGPLVHGGQVVDYAVR